MLAKQERRKPARHRALRPLATPKRLAIGTLAIIVVLALWQLLTATHVLNVLLASSPTRIVDAAYQGTRSGELPRSILQSGITFGISFGITLVIGILGGMLIGWYSSLQAICDPFVNILNSAPRIAFIPLFILWLGIGLKAQIAVVVSLAVFPLIINVSAGIEATDRQLVTLARSFMGSDLQILWTIAVPGAIPHVISGIRQALAQALVGVVVAEYLVGSNGLGGLILDSGQSLDTSLALAGVAVITAVALILTALLRKIERRVDHWRMV